ncbi:uncharacterized protein LOC108632913 [Ceratina calcarata]|uniref:Uncharacterized protein LOC108632913 n=1 Tax=Ceratina calcarata TaxID=156304 RepID=A0AAJ7JGX9_9HYME|nr:uncharacterized protein LOC108632913 [Ceratina calcarata]
MGDSLNERIDNLRRRSKILLARVEENSKRVKDEIKRFYSQDLILRESCRKSEKRPSKANVQSWKLRNDSSGVGGALGFEHFRNSSESLASMPNAKRVLTSSKKCHEHQCCTQLVHRTAVKECYCNPEVKRIQSKPARVRRKQYSPCKRCKSHTAVPAIVIEDNSEKPALTSPISCETLRRVKKIDYTPRSQFLRNVKSKVSFLHYGTGDCPETCYKSRYYHELMSRRDDREDDYTYRLKQSSPNHLTVPDNSETGEYSNLGNLERKSSKGVQVSLNPKVIKKTLTSKTSVPDVKKTESSSKLAPKSKNAESQYSERDRQTRSKTSFDGENRDLENARVNKPTKETEILSEREVRELKKFRELNYFDTHGSSQALGSSKSTGSLEQYLLNDRLFPEPARCVHRKNLVVTMPACVTTQWKRMHYFPRYIVRQEKSDFNVNQKKKRCQACPLTGHAVDLGITKIRAPLSSLALKYQKRLP